MIDRQGGDGGELFTRRSIFPLTFSLFSSFLRKLGQVWLMILFQEKICVRECLGKRSRWERGKGEGKDWQGDVVYLSFLFCFLSSVLIKVLGMD